MDHHPTDQIDALRSAVLTLIEVVAETRPDIAWAVHRIMRDTVRNLRRDGETARGDCHMDLVMDMEDRLPPPEPPPSPPST